MILENHLYFMYLKMMSLPGRDIARKSFHGSSIEEICESYDELFVLKTNIEAELCVRFTALGHVDLDLRIPEDNLGVHWDICDGLLRTFTMVDDLKKVWMSESIDTHKNPYRTDGGGFTICRLDGQRYAILDSNLEIKTSRQ